MRANHKFITATRPSPSLSLKSHTFRLQTTYIAIFKAISCIQIVRNNQPLKQQTNFRFPKNKNCHFPKHSRRDTLNKGHLNDWIVGYLNLLICTRLVLNNIHLCVVTSCNKPQVSPLTICNFRVPREWDFRMKMRCEYKKYYLFVFIVNNGILLTPK